MSWRTVVISGRCKLDLSLAYMVVRGEETKRVLIDEMAVLIIEDPAVSLTGCLLSELTRKKVRIIFCDEKRNPYGELQPYNGSFDCSRKLKVQSMWTNDQKLTVWTEIVSQKIRNQATLLAKTGKTDESGMLAEYVTQIQYGDTTNREGHAAKVYFNALFGKGFSRGQEGPLNAALNYGYGIILSAFNREVTLNGYSTHMGIFHDNMFNHYNLSCDLMEPFRVIVDREVLSMAPTDFTKDEKYKLIAMLHSTVKVSGYEQTVLNAIKIYTKSVFDAINDIDVSLIKFAEL